MRNCRTEFVPGGSFLWTLEDDGRAARVRRGEIVVGAGAGPESEESAGRLDPSLDGRHVRARRQARMYILEITRDYDHFKEFYRPLVIESKTLARDGLEDDFSMVLMNQSLLLKTAVDADYHSCTVRLDDHRFYSVARTTRRPGSRRIRPTGSTPNP